MAEYKGKYKSVYCPGIEFESDYIAREAARDLMYHNQYPLTEYDLNDLPPADVRPVVRGRWVKVGGFCTPGGDPVWQCSECGKGQHVYGIEHATYGASVSDGQWVSCPNCGADMRGGDAE